MRTTHSLLVLLACGGLLSAAPVPGAAPKSAVDKVRQALEQPISLELADQPLAAVLGQLRELVKVHFVLDRHALLDFADPSELTVTVSVKQMKAGVVLRQMLAEYNLVPVVAGEMVLVTTPEAAARRQMRQRVNVDLDSVPLQAALRQLARQTGTNLVLDPRLSKEGLTPVTLQLEDVPLETAVKLIAEIAGLKSARVGNVLFVTSEARAERLHEPDVSHGEPVPAHYSIERFIGGIPLPGGAPPPPAPAPAPKP